MNAVEQFVSRYLQEGDSDPGVGTDPIARQRDVYEFFAFMAWYMFLVVCCLVPTACAYRRRRILERRLARQAYLQHRASQGFIFISGLELAAFDQVDGEERRIRWLAKVNEAVSETTFRVLGEHLSKREEKEGGERDDDIEAFEDREFSHLSLPSELPNGDRFVVSVCPICLCEYEEDDNVTFSPKQHCKHCFHNDCIVQWLAKKGEFQCPCCRQEFCENDEAPDENDVAAPETGNDEES